MIWLAFLLPSRKRSPASSVEDFERRMSLLAEANHSVPGRWVLMPRKGARLVGSGDCGRAKARRRRRQLFMVLLEMTALTFMMGLFPPFRVMLYGTGILAFVLLAYAAVLVKIREQEFAKALLRIAMEPKGAYEGVAPGARTRVPVATGRYAVPAGHPNGNGHPNGHANGNGYANGNGHAHANGNGHPNGNANGNGHANGNGRGELDAILREGGVEIIDDDIHIVVRPAREFADQAARSSGR